MANMNGRVELVRAMDYIARSVNNEDFIDQWLTFGVADGDGTQDDEYLSDMYCDDECLKSLMDTFLSIMTKARKDGGLYCDGICGGEK